MFRRFRRRCIPVNLPPPRGAALIMKTRLIFKRTFAAFATGAISLASAQEPAVPESSTNSAMTLEALASEAVASNPELRFYEAQIAAARAGRRQAGVLENPGLSASVGAKRVSGAGASSEGIAWSASVLQSFELPGRLSLRKAIANGDIQLAELGLAQFKAALAGRARVSGYKLFVAQEKARATAEVANRLQELLDFLVQRDPAGIAPLLETRIIEAGVVTFRKQAIEASEALQSALFAVNRLRGRPLDTPLQVDAADVQLPPVPDREALLESARRNNFDIRMRQVELEQQGLKVELSRNQRWPDIALGPTVSREEAGERETVIGIGIPLPLPIWNRNAGNIETEQARRQQAETSLFLVQLEVEQSVLEQWLAYRLRKEELDRWQPDAIQRFHQAADLGDRHYRLGSLPVATYIELQREYLEALDSILSLKAEALESVQKLQVLTQTEPGRIAAAEARVTGGGGQE